VPKQITADVIEEENSAANSVQDLIASTDSFEMEGGAKAVAPVAALVAVKNTHKVTASNNVLPEIKQPAMKMKATDKKASEAVAGDKMETAKPTTRKRNATDAAKSVAGDMKAPNI